jgi:FkbM family methyltransferase
MNNLIKKVTIYIIKIFLKNVKAFDFLQKEVENNILYNTIHKYKYLGIKNVYDIGANKAIWSMDMKKKFPSFNYFLFEASIKNKNALDKSKFKYFINCLSSEEKELDFYEIGGTGDSYYKEISNYYKNVEPTKVKARKLSNLVIENNLPLPDFIKNRYTRFRN